MIFRFLKLGFTLYFMVACVLALTVLARLLLGDIPQGRWRNNRRYFQQGFTLAQKPALAFEKPVETTWVAIQKWDGKLLNVCSEIRFRSST